MTINTVIEKVSKILSLQGFACPLCPNSKYILLPLSECKDISLSPIKAVNKENLRFLLVMKCSGKETFRFEVMLKRSDRNGK